MGRIKNIKIFGKRNYESGSLEPKRVFILSVEGNKTEYDYFTYIEENKDELNISQLIKINLIERFDTNSSPEWVNQLLHEYTDTYGLTERDSLWMIIDRDLQNNSEEVIQKVIEDCENNNFKIAITNPCFELWLLLHCIKDIDDYDKEALLNNPKKRMRAKKRFIDDELTRINGSYNKYKINKEHFITKSKINNAIRLEQKIENDSLEIINSLGSNVGSLLLEIMKNEV